MKKISLFGYINVLDGVKSIYNAIQKRKALFIFLLVFQLLFIIVLSSVFIKYQIVLFNDLQAIGTPLESLNLNEESLQEGEPIVDNPFALLSAYNSLIQHISQLFLWLSILFLLINPWLWIGASYIMSSGFKKGISLKRRSIIFLKMWVKYVTSAFILFIPFGLVVYFVLLKTIGAYNPYFASFARVFASIFFLFFFVFLVSNSRIEIGNWKKYVKEVYHLISYNIIWSFLAVLIVTGLVSLISFSLYYSTLIMENFPLMIISATAFILVLVVGKMYVIAVSKSLAEK